MTTSTLEVGDLISVLSARGLEKQLTQVPGVDRVSVGAVSGSATVTYDAGKTSLSALKQMIIDCGFHCSGEVLPRHLLRQHDGTGRQ